jgi:hypothetical protein
MEVAHINGDNTVVLDSKAILHYINSELSGPSLAPACPVLRAFMDRFIELMDSLPMRTITFTRCVIACTSYSLHLHFV